MQSVHLCLLIVMFSCSMDLSISDNNDVQFYAVCFSQSWSVCLPVNYQKCCKTFCCHFPVLGAFYVDWWLFFDVRVHFSSDNFGRFYPVVVLGFGWGGPQAPSFALPPVSWLAMMFCKDNTNIWCLWVSKLKKSGQKPKVLQLQGALPLALWPGAMPVDPTGALLPDPHYRLTLSHLPWGHALPSPLDIEG